MIVLRGHHLELFRQYLLAREDPKALEAQKKSIMKSTSLEGHGKRHGENTLRVLEKALNPDEIIRVVDSIDDICLSCNHNTTRQCTQLLPYGPSAACEDRQDLGVLGIQKGTYTSGFIQKKLLDDYYL